MRKSILLVFMSILLGIILIASSCTSTQPGTTQGTSVVGQTSTPTSVAPTSAIKTTAPPTTTAASDMVLDPSTGKLITKPTYGGTATFRMGADTSSFDPYLDAQGSGIASFTLEKLAMGDWAYDRSKFQFVPNYIPLEVYRGILATGWETPDPNTFIIHIRQGVHWINKPPMNGREMTAADVVFSYNRGLGLGDGFTKPSALTMQAASGVTSVTAIDKYTVQVKLKTPNLNSLSLFLCEDNPVAWIVPPEVIKQYGNLLDWKNLIGTGPFIIVDHVPDSSWTFNKNPDYWGYDEKFPSNKIPYVDQVRLVVIQDASTALAALRAGKIEVLGASASQAQTLLKTNPELRLVTYENNCGAIPLNVTSPPFNDLRVRQAMQMALDLPSILKQFYLGFGDATPFGQLSPADIGYYPPYATWPDAVKATYTYNVEGAKKLLTAAGYPKGFETTWDACGAFSSITADPDLAVLLKDYWSKIGVTVNIKSIDAAAYFGAIYAKKVAPMATITLAWSYDPVGALKIFYYSKSTFNIGQVNDPVYDAMVDKAQAATTRDEQKAGVIACENYAIAQQWMVILPRPSSFIFYQPWFKGSNGEGTMGGGQSAYIYARTWIDSAVKKSMGK